LDASGLSPFCFKSIDWSLQPTPSKKQKAGGYCVTNMLSMIVCFIAANGVAAQTGA
jgi:hypothetical protein